MEFNKLALVGGVAGLTLTLSSWLRYFVMYPDLDKAIGYGCVGLLIVAVSYLWDKRCKDANKNKEDIEKLQITLLEVEEFLANNTRGGKTYGK